MGKRVLVVDDEQDVVSYLCAILRDNGYETVEAFDGEQAMKEVGANRPDLITLDVTMPEMTGVKAYRKLKEDPSLKSIPVVIITGVSHDFKQFISSRSQVPPPEGYLEKPIKPEELLNEVRKHIG
jgi:two-component system, OmpR family, phosphate regulon response regulator PhoB